MSRAVYLDTNAFISAFESTTERSEWMWGVLDAVSAGEFKGITSELTLAELLPKPLSLGQTDLAAFYVETLFSNRYFDVLPVTRTLLVATGTLRSQHAALRLPDAIHLATATQCRCGAILTDDRRLPLPAGMQAVRLGSQSLEQIRILSA